MVVAAPCALLPNGFVGHTATSLDLQGLMLKNQHLKKDSPLTLKSEFLETEHTVVSHIQIHIKPNKRIKGCYVLLTGSNSCVSLGEMWKLFPAHSIMIDIPRLPSITEKMKQLQFSLKQTQIDLLAKQTQMEDLSKKLEDHIKTKSGERHWNLLKNHVKATKSGSGEQKTTSLEQTQTQQYQNNNKYTFILLMEGKLRTLTKQCHTLKKQVKRLEN